MSQQWRLVALGSPKVYIPTTSPQCGVSTSPYSVGSRIQERTSRWTIGSYEVGNTRSANSLQHPRRMRKIYNDKNDEIIRFEEPDYINSLRPDLLKLIFGFLTTKDRCLSAAVCKNWLEILARMQKHCDLYCIKFICNHQHFQPIDGIRRFLRGVQANGTRFAAMCVGASGKVHDLSVAGSHPASYLSSSLAPISDDSLDIFAQENSNLIRLSLVNCPMIGDKGLKHVANGCSSLVTLELVQAISVTDKGLQYLASKCLKLERLIFAECPCISDRSLQAFAQHSTELLFFQLTRCPLITAHGITQIIHSAAHLQTVNISSMELSPSFLRAISHYGKEILDLKLENISGLNGEDYAWIGGAEELLCLELKTCSGLTDGSFMKTLPFSFFKLDSLVITNCDLLTDIGLDAVTSQAKMLQVLSLESCDSLTEAGLMLAIKKCKYSLKELTLVRCSIKVQKEKPNNIWRECKWLETLKLDSCSGIGDYFVCWVTTSCRRLKDISINNMSSITGRGIETFLLHSETRRIETLSLSGCCHVTDRAIAMTAKKCWNLVELDVAGCDITDDGFLKFTEEMPKYIKRISLAGCTKITGRGLCLLGDTHSPNMTLINISGCAGIDNNTLYLMKLNFNVIV